MPKKMIDTNWKNDLNILFVSLDSPDDIIEYYNYLINPIKGFLNYDSYYKHENYNKIDIIVLSNLVKGHRDLTKLDSFDSFDLCNYFSYFIINTYSEKHLQIMKHNFILLLKESVLNKKCYFISDLGKSVYNIFISTAINGLLNPYDIESLLHLMSEVTHSTIDALYDAPILMSSIFSDINNAISKKIINQDVLQNHYNIALNLFPNSTLDYEKSLNEYLSTISNEYKFPIDILFFKEYINNKSNILL